jgi:hypothetical protein
LLSRLIVVGGLSRRGDVVRISVAARRCVPEVRGVIWGGFLRDAVVPLRKSMLDTELPAAEVAVVRELVVAIAARMVALGHQSWFSSAP